MHQISEMEALDQLDWWYNWGPNADSVAMHRSAELGIEFVPMQWGKWGIETLSKDIQPEAKHLLGFNEPGHQEQSNLQPEEAAALWPSMQGIAHDMGLKLGTPSPAPCGAQCVRASPFQWCVHAYTDCLSHNNQVLLKPAIEPSTPCSLLVAAYSLESAYASQPPLPDRPHFMEGKYQCTLARSSMTSQPDSL